MMPWSLVQLPRPALAGLLLVLDQGRATEDDEEEAKAKVGVTRLVSGATECYHACTVSNVILWRQHSIAPDMAFTAQRLKVP